jgi:hypothetical protein
MLRKKRVKMAESSAFDSCEYSATNTIKGIEMVTGESIIEIR